MSKKAKVLFVSQEIFPYVEESHMSKIARRLPQGIQENGSEVRIFMPRYGCINERRNQLHEVIRLSGMNLIIDDSDHPLIIKVASVPSARMQVYFIDNEEYFQRKFMMHDAEQKFYNDNPDRAVFFCRGVLETVKKLNWCPDVIHCHGWFSSLIPFFLKTSYKDDPVFQNTKTVLSVYDDNFSENINDFGKKLKMDGVSASDLNAYANFSYTDVYKAGIDHSDASIYGVPELSEDIAKHMKGSPKPVIEYKNETEYLEAYANLYEELVEEVLEA